MNKEDFIEKYGVVAYEKRLQTTRDWRASNPDAVWYINNRWRKVHSEKVAKKHCEQCRKGGKKYRHTLEYNRTGLQGERNIIRRKHQKQYRVIKQVTPNSVLHHEWMPGTAKYRGVALVNKEAHQKGSIKVIKVLEDKITLFEERELAEQGGVQQCWV